ncbi:MAG: hypothetical protein IJX17_08105 [Clostridia bacterium]|nr:hypothetical protein [Clostridia bacterium]
MKKNNIVADMHVHLYDNPSEKDFFEILDMAEANGVKCLALLEFNNLNLYKSGLWDKVKDKIKKHYSGKLVTAIEFVSTIDDIKSPATGFNYDGYRSDIVLYDFDPEKLMPLFEDSFLQKLWEDDCSVFVQKLGEYGFYPPKNIFINDGHPASYAKHYLDYLFENPEEKERFIKTFNLKKLDVESDITRNLITNPKGELFFHQKLFPNSSEVFRIAKQIGGKICLAHPAYMSGDFDTQDYIKTMVELSKSNPEEFKPIEMITGTYMLDRAKDTEVVEKSSEEFGLIKIPTSDVKTQYRRIVNGKDEPVMYCITEINGEKTRVNYRPRPGFAICPWIESYLSVHNGKVEDFADFEKSIENAPANLSLDQSVFNKFKDARDYGFSMEAYNERQ